MGKTIGTSVPQRSLFNSTPSSTQTLSKVCNSYHHIGHNRKNISIVKINISTVREANYHLTYTGTVHRYQREDNTYVRIALMIPMLGSSDCCLLSLQTLGSMELLSTTLALGAGDDDTNTDKQTEVFFHAEPHSTFRVT